MYFFLSKIFSFISSPLFWVMLCLLPAVLLKNEKRRRKFLVAGIIMLLFFTNPLITNSVLQWWETPPVSASTINKPYDVAVVLGGAMRYYNNQTKRVVYGSSVDRVLQAIEFFPAQWDPKLGIHVT